MKPNKLLILSSAALGMFAISAADAEAQMHRGGRPALRPMASRHFRDGDRDFDGRLHRFNNFVFFGFGFPYYYSYPYYGYPYGYYAPLAYQNYGAPGYQNQAFGDASVVLQVQRRLAREGYYHGAIDGVIGSGTRRALRAYERAHGLPIDGSGLIHLTQVRLVPHYGDRAARFWAFWSVYASSLPPEHGSTGNESSGKIPSFPRML